jgi:hypothetical protein
VLHSHAQRQRFLRSRSIAARSLSRYHDLCARGAHGSGVRRAVRPSLSIPSGPTGPVRCSYGLSRVNFVG